LTGPLEDFVEQWPTSQHELVELTVKFADSSASVLSGSIEAADWLGPTAGFTNTEATMPVVDDRNAPDRGLALSALLANHTGTGKFDCDRKPDEGEVDRRLC